jgi:antitoxin YefM
VELGKATARSAALVFSKPPPGHCRSERDDVGFAKDLKIMTILNATEARFKLYSSIDEAASTHQPIVITGKRGNAVLVSVDDWNSIAETLHLLSVPRMTKSIKEGMETPIRMCQRIELVKWALVYRLQAQKDAKKDAT